MKKITPYVEWHSRLNGKGTYSRVVARVVGISLLFMSLIPSKSFAIPTDKVSDRVKDSSSGINPQDDSYKINFNNVSIIEYIHFVSRITNLNFIFEEEDLQFAVTVVSEEPLTAKNVMAALVQILRVHNLTLLEQDNNLIITKGKNVNQISTLVTTDLPDSTGENAALVTRVFRIKNANLSSVAAIIRPMTSQAAIIEMSHETRQLIVTDITPNVEKISSLLASIDAPHTPLEIDTYNAKNISPDELIALTTQIITPFAEGNPLLFVPQIDTNTVFIVSTPYLIEKALTVMEDLDVSSKEEIIPKSLSSENILVYKIQSVSPDMLQTALEQIAADLGKQKPIPTRLLNLIQGVKWIQGFNALLFIGDEENLQKVKEILATLDTPQGDTPAGKATFYLYRIQHTAHEQIEEALRQTVANLAKKPGSLSLIDALNSVKWIQETNSLLFLGREGDLKQIEAMLPSFDQLSTHANFFLYTPKERPGEEILQSLQEIQENLANSGLADQALLQALASVKWTPSSNNLVFTGTAPSLDRIQEILQIVDSTASKQGRTLLYPLHRHTKDEIENALKQIVQKLNSKEPADQALAKAIQERAWKKESNSFFFQGASTTLARLKEILIGIDGGEESSFSLYKLEYAQGAVLAKHLKEMGDQLALLGVADPALLKTLAELKWVKENNSLLLTGSTAAMETVKGLVAQFDTPDSLFVKSDPSFFLYKPLYRSADVLKAALITIAQDLKNAGLEDKTLLQVLKTARYNTATEALIFTGDTEMIGRVKELLAATDHPLAEEEAVHQLGKLSFLIYQLQHASAPQFISSLQTFAANTKGTSSENKAFIQAIESLKWIPETSSILFTGPPAVLKKISQLTHQLDNKALATSQKELVARATPSHFFLYKPRYLKGPELLTVLREFEGHLRATQLADPELFDTLDHLKWIEKTSSLLLSGTPAGLAKVEELLQKFDLPRQEGVLPPIETIDNINFLVYKLQYHQGSEIQTALKQIADSLIRTNKSSNQTLLDAINSLQWIKVTNSLLGTGDPAVLTHLRELIQTIDIPLRQVFIEVLVIETTLRNIQSFGLRWGAKVKHLNKAAGSVGNFPPQEDLSTGFAPGLTAVRPSVPPDPAMIPFMSGFDLGVIGDVIMHKGRSFVSLGALVNALQTDENTTIMMNPKILTQDNNTSTIFIGQNIPFTGSQVQIQGDNLAKATNIEYREVGVNLTITPVLGDGDIVTLDISNDISAEMASGDTSIPSDLSGLRTTHTTMNTKVHVPNNHFLVLSGMIHDIKKHNTAKVPCLGGLPFLGAAFTQKDRLNTKDNLIIFVRPHIIDSFEDYKKLTDKEEDTYRQQVTLPVLQEEFDENVNVVKQPEDE